jgi:ADP-ribose pyrophosphatase YjhB (NUDIX family)
MITCTFPDGKPANLRHVCCDGLIVRDDQILLVKRAEWLSEAGKFCVPGGYMDRDEVVHTCVVREAKEETGWDCSIKSFFAVVDSPERGDDRQNIGFIFLLEPIEQTGKPDNESSEVTWFDLESLPENIAFDHRRVIEAYKNYRKDAQPLPIFIS